MTGNSHPDNALPFILRLFIDMIYFIGSIVSLVVGVYGLSLVRLTIFPPLSYWVVGLLFGLPMVVASTGYLIFVSRSLFLSSRRKNRYAPRSWIVALLWAVLIGLFGYWVYFIAFHGL